MNTDQLQKDITASLNITTKTITDLKSLLPLLNDPVIREEYNLTSSTIIEALEYPTDLEPNELYIFWLCARQIEMMINDLILECKKVLNTA